MPIPSDPDPGNCDRASTYAAGTQMTTVMTTTASPTSPVLRTQVLKFVLSNRYCTRSSVGASWKRSGLFWRLSRSFSCLDVGGDVKASANHGQDRTRWE